MSGRRQIAKSRGRDKRSPSQLLSNFVKRLTPSDLARRVKRKRERESKTRSFRIL